MTAIIVIAFFLCVILAIVKEWHDDNSTQNEHSADLTALKRDSFIPPKYITDFTIVQDSDQSITVNGTYDLTRFSTHEVDTIIHVLNHVKTAYPPQYQSIGLANESSAIKYKARYVLFQIIILKYWNSKEPIDRFAVAVAYQSKGALFRKYAISYYESSLPYIKEKLLQDFLNLSPLSTYNAVSRLYEQEHEYEKAIYYLRLAKPYSEKIGPAPYYDEHQRELEGKIQNPPIRRPRKATAERIKSELELVDAAKYFIEHPNLPSQPLFVPQSTANNETENKKKPVTQKNALSNKALEDYAAMCNAYLKREDDMEWYKQTFGID